MYITRNNNNVLDLAGTYTIRCRNAYIYIISCGRHIFILYGHKPDHSVCALMTSEKYVLTYIYNIYNKIDPIYTRRELDLRGS